MLLLIIVSILSAFQETSTQNITTLAGSCNQRYAFFYGNCRVNTCLASETSLVGASFCDVYTRYLGIRYVHCAAILPCCVRGGQCRQTCGAGETQLAVPSDCTATRRWVCCVRNTVAQLPPNSTVSPLVPVTERQGPTSN